jgi:hypothetical protein
MIRHYSLNNVHDTHMYHAPIISIAWSQRAWLCSSTFLYLLEIKYCSHLLVFICCLVYFYINSMDIKYNKPSDYSLCSHFFFLPRLSIMFMLCSMIAPLDFRSRRLYLKNIVFNVFIVKDGFLIKYKFLYLVLLCFSF